MFLLFWASLTHTALLGSGAHPLKHRLGQPGPLWAHVLWVCVGSGSPDNFLILLKCPSFSLVLKNSVWSQRTNSTVRSYRSWEVWQPAFILSHLFPLQFKLAVFLLGWLIRWGPWFTPIRISLSNGQSDTVFSPNILSLSLSLFFFFFFNMDKLRLFQIFKFFVPFCLTFFFLQFISLSSRFTIRHQQ